MKVSARRNDGRYFKLGNQFTDDVSERMIFIDAHHAKMAITELYKLWKWRKERAQINYFKLKEKMSDELACWTITEEGEKDA